MGALRKAHKEAVYTRFMEFVTEYFMHHPCEDCGIADPIVLDFDHVRGDKRHNVSKLAKDGYSWEAIMAEIAKCDVVCSNCHRRRTAKRAKHRRWVYFAEL